LGFDDGGLALHGKKINLAVGIDRRRGVVSVDPLLPDDFTGIRPEAGGYSGIAYRKKIRCVIDERRNTRHAFGLFPSNMSFGNITLSACANGSDGWLLEA